MSFKFVPFPADDLPDDETLSAEQAMHLASDDELASEDQLPADFAALGEQLQVDALRLGSVYPACRPPLELIDALAARPKHAKMWRWIAGGSLAAATILLAAGLAIIANSPHGDDSRIAESSGAAAIAPAAPTAIPHVATFAQAPALPAEPTGRWMSNSRFPSLVNPGTQPVSYHPAVTEVNGPQLEGLLDLWNEQPQAGATIAF